MASSARSKQFGLGCLVLFALPFAAVGIGSTYWVLHLATKHSEMKSWVEVPATIEHVELTQGKNSRRRRGLKAVARYAYEFEGRKYTGDQVSMHRGSDNLGSFQRDAYNEIHRHFVQKKPFRAFVNPTDPTESVLFRDLRWEAIAFFSMFAAAFGCIGIGVLAGTLYQVRERAIGPTGEVPGDQPWLERADWASGQIRPLGGASTGVPILAAVAIFWWVASVPLLFKLPEILPPAKGQAAWLVLVFPLIGLLMLALLVHQFLRKQKFGESTLQLASIPGVIGGQLAGVVRIERSVQAANGYLLKLSCVENVRRKNDDSKEELLWQDERLVTEPMRDAAAGSLAVPVLFAIPYKAQETSHGDSKRDIEWRLEVTAKMPGVDYKTRFEVPVFKTPDSRPDFKLDDKLSADFTAPPPNDLLLREAGIVKERLAGDGVRLVFPAARNLSSALGITAFATLWSAAIWFMLHVKAFLLFPIIFTLVGIFILGIAVELWFYRSVVEARADGLTFRGGLFGIGRKHFWAANEIKRFSTEDSMSSGTNVWKHVVLVPKQGKKRKIGRTIPGKLAQQAVIDELNAALRRADEG